MESTYSPYTGRSRIYSKYEMVDASNVLSMLMDAITTHDKNVSDISYLWKYYRGDQPILRREKSVRPEINNTIVENHAQEIVSFKTGYQLSEPIQYVCHPYGDESEESYAEQIALLNRLMFAEDSDSKNRDLFEWMCIAGVGYKFIEPDKTDEEHGNVESFDLGGAPFNIHIPDPRNVFIVYSDKYHHSPIAGVWVNEDNDKKRVYTVYTNKDVFIVDNGKIVGSAVNGIGFIPIIEYNLNNARMGVFEAALPVLDAINALESNRLDGVEQVVQALYLFKNCQIDEESFLNMLQLGAVSVSSTEGAQGDVSLITNNLDQSQTQTTKDDLYQALIDICGMPNRNQGGANDTGSAVLLRDGWTLAESHAKSYELQFKKAERNFLRVALHICNMSGEQIDLRLRDVDLAFNRRNYDNILTKAQVLTTLLATNKVDPLDCFKVCGLFNDPAAAYLRAEAYKADMESKYELIYGQQKPEEPIVDHDMDGMAGEPS